MLLSSAESAKNELLLVDTILRFVLILRSESSEPPYVDASLSSIELRLFRVFDAFVLLICPPIMETDKDGETALCLFQASLALLIISYLFKLSYCVEGGLPIGRDVSLSGES